MRAAIVGTFFTLVVSLSGAAHAAPSLRFVQPPEVADAAVTSALSVQVSDGGPLAGATVRFDATRGFFLDGRGARIEATTNERGEATVHWMLGEVLGVGATRTVRIQATLGGEGGAAPAAQAIHPFLARAFDRQHSRPPRQTLRAVCPEGQGFVAAAVGAALAADAVTEVRPRFIGAYVGDHLTASYRMSVAEDECDACDECRESWWNPIENYCFECAACQYQKKVLGLRITSGGYFAQRVPALLGNPTLVPQDLRMYVWLNPLVFVPLPLGSFGLDVRQRVEYSSPEFMAYLYAVALDAWKDVFQTVFMANLDAVMGNPLSALKGIAKALFWIVWEFLAEVAPVYICGSPGEIFLDILHLGLDLLFDDPDYTTLVFPFWLGKTEMDEVVIEVDYLAARPTAGIEELQTELTWSVSTCHSITLPSLPLMSGWLTPYLAGEVCPLGPVNLRVAQDLEQRLKIVERPECIPGQRRCAGPDEYFPGAYLEICAWDRSDPFGMLGWVKVKPPPNHYCASWRLDDPADPGWSTECDGGGRSRCFRAADGWLMKADCVFGPADGLAAHWHWQETRAPAGMACVGPHAVLAPEGRPNPASRLVPFRPPRIPDSPFAYRPERLCGEDWTPIDDWNVDFDTFIPEPGNCPLPYFPDPAEGAERTFALDAERYPVWLMPGARCDSLQRVYRCSEEGRLYCKDCVAEGRADSPAVDFWGTSLVCSWDAWEGKYGCGSGAVQEDPSGEQPRDLVPCEPACEDDQLCTWTDSASPATVCEDPGHRPSCLSFGGGNWAGWDRREWSEDEDELSCPHLAALSEEQRCVCQITYDDGLRRDTHRCHESGACLSCLDRGAPLVNGALQDRCGAWAIGSRNEFDGTGCSCHPSCVFYNTLPCCDDFCEVCPDSIVQPEWAPPDEAWQGLEAFPACGCQPSRATCAQPDPGIPGAVSCGSDAPHDGCGQECACPSSGQYTGACVVRIDPDAPRGEALRHVCECSPNVFVGYWGNGEYAKCGDDGCGNPVESWGSVGTPCPDTAICGPNRRCACAGPSFSWTSGLSPVRVHAAGSEVVGDFEGMRCCAPGQRVVRRVGGWPPAAGEVPGTRYEDAHSRQAFCCQPQACTAGPKPCGFDGCGVPCGACADPADALTCSTCDGPQDLCVDNQCVCQPRCHDGPKACGDDGCGGSCGTCAADETCTSYRDGMGLCLPSAPSDGRQVSAQPGCGEGCYCERWLCGEGSPLAYCCAEAWDQACVDDCRIHGGGTVTDCGNGVCEWGFGHETCEPESCPEDCGCAEGELCLRRMRNGYDGFLVVPACDTPSCEQRVCGPDFTGTLDCGQCPEGSVCDRWGHCYTTGCEGHCQGSGWNWQMDCYCDEACAVLGDCCADVCEQCGDVGSVGEVCSPDCVPDCSAYEGEFYLGWLDWMEPPADSSDYVGPWTGPDGCGALCPCPEGTRPRRLPYALYERDLNAWMCVPNAPGCAERCGQHGVIDRGVEGAPEYCTCDSKCPYSLWGGLEEYFVDPEGLPMEVPCCDDLCAPCEPTCDGRVCGGDGCGGSCGDCAGAGEVCVAGACVCVPQCGEQTCGPDPVCGAPCGECPAGYPCVAGGCVCLPDCEDKECGDDGCGALCGACAEGFVCSDGVCECVPQCAGSACGDDGCGGSCGACGADEACVDGGCVACASLCAGRDCGVTACGERCGECSDGQLCLDGACICEPRCAAKACGDDGCGDVCGLCAAGETCTPAGACVPLEPSDGRTVSGLPGCGQCPCEDCVCERLPECCTDGWTLACAAACVQDCGGSLTGQCGNGACEGNAGETCESCPRDCGCGLAEGCVAGVCVDCSCAGRECGATPCGTSCGACVAGTECRDGIRCVPLPSPSDGCRASSLPACPGCGCEACVCAAMPACCSDAWTAACAALCAGECAGCGGSCPQLCAAGAVCQAGRCRAPSCAGRCGEDTLRGDGVSCLCDPGCLESGDCCPDLCAACPATPGCSGACGDGRCDPGAGESCAVCAVDCACAAGEVCSYPDDGPPQCCQPACDGRSCGADGCGGTCGDCLGSAAQCVEGACRCTPDCEGRTCGDDGCAGSCGDCGEDQECRSGACVTAGSCRGACGSAAPGGCLCTPDCFALGRCCGDVCAACPDLRGCTGHCGDGECQAELAEDCATCAVDCGCAPDQDCVGGVCCVAACGEAQCGPDGCGGSCGECGATARCVAGRCVEGPGCAVRAQGGCAGCACERAVCAGLPACCQEAWTAECAALCARQPSGCGALAACGDGQCSPQDGETCSNCAADCACAQGASCTRFGCCTPACGGRECGADGCGGDCGECAGVCRGGVCLDPAADCVPDCVGRVCGSDGCGGECGVCAGLCLDGTCRQGPGCTTSEAGGCGGCACEACVCAADPRCCSEGWDALCAQRCEEQCFGCRTPGRCGDGVCRPFEGEDCGACPADCGCGAGQRCVAGGCCSQQCEGKACGDDGCGGTCGDCRGADEACVAGQCVPQAQPDLGVPDLGALDLGRPDGAVAPPEEDDPGDPGCGCRAAPGPLQGFGLFGLVLALGLLRRQR